MLSKQSTCHFDPHLVHGMPSMSGAIVQKTPQRCIPSSPSEVVLLITHNTWNKCSVCTLVEGMSGHTYSSLIESRTSFVSKPYLLCQVIPAYRAKTVLTIEFWFFQQKGHGNGTSGNPSLHNLNLPDRFMSPQH